MATEFLTKCLDRLERIIIAQRENESDKEPNVIRKAREEVRFIESRSVAGRVIRDVSFDCGHLNLTFTDTVAISIKADDQAQWAIPEGKSDIAIELGSVGPVQYRMHLDGRAEYRTMKPSGGHCSWFPVNPSNPADIRGMLLNKFGIADTKEDLVLGLSSKEWATKHRKLRMSISDALDGD